LTAFFETKSWGIMPGITFENHLKGGYSIEKGDVSLKITSSSCYWMKEETLFLIDNLPREGSKECYVKALSLFGIEKTYTIFDRLLDVGVLREKVPTPLFKKIISNLIKPDITLFSAKSQENILKKFSVRLSRDWLLKNLRLLFLLAASGIVVSLVISFTKIFPWLAGMSAGRLDTMLLFALVLLSSLMHELGHSFTIAACGLGLRPIGFTVYLIYPVFYTNVSGIEKLTTREKAAVDCGGFFLQSVYLLLLFILWLSTNNMLFLESIRWISVIMVCNINPFLRTDGYWLYKDVRKGLSNNKFADAFQYLFLIAFSAFSLYLFSYVYSRMASIYDLIFQVCRDPKFMLHEGYKIILGFYLIIMCFVGGICRFRETRKEWLELRNSRN
jgi:hypothetical protein